MADAGRAPAGEPEPVGEQAEPAAERRRRPLIERLGMASVAVVLGVLFGGVAVAAWTNGEPFLGVMGAIGCLMTIWVGALTLVRG